MLKIEFHIQFTHIKILDQCAYTKNISKRLENTNLNMYATILKQQSMGINSHKDLLVYSNEISFSLELLIL